MMERIYVTGSRGMLGKALVPLLSQKYEVKGSDLPECDITDEESIAEDIASFSPHRVFHLASMTDVDLCERDPERAYLVNAAGTRNVALASKKADAVMAYISTGMIYNGRKRYPYTEYDRPDPVNVYGSTKHQGEIEIRKLLKKYYIFNTCWIFGGGKEDRKFVQKILRLAGEKTALKIVDDRFGSPTYTLDLAEKIIELSETGQYGRYHCVNGGCISRFGLAKKIFEIAGISGCRLEPVSSIEFPADAPRPYMEGMISYRTLIEGLKPMRPWEEALEAYVTSPD